MSHFRRFVSGAVLLVAFTTSTTSVANAADALDGIPSWYRDFQKFPACSASVASFCIQSWGVDINRDGVYETPDPSLHVSFAAWVYNIEKGKEPSLVYELEVNREDGSTNFQELAPEIPVGTSATFSINTGGFEPTASLFASSDVSYIDVQQVNGNWITTGVIQTFTHTAAIGCEIDCEHPTKTYDYDSFAQGVLWYEKPSALRDSEHGMWVSSNASVTGQLNFDATTLTFSVDLLGPAKRPDGTDNILRYSAFLPDSFIQYAYGTTADVLATSLSTTRTDFGVTTSVKATATRVTSPIAGLLVSMPNIRLSGAPVAAQSVHASGSRYSTTPTLKIKPKNSLLRAPTIHRVIRASSTSVRVSGSPVSGATGYQAMCSRGIITHFANAKSATVTVKDLVPGAWSCKIRAVKKVGGRWSANLVTHV